MSQFAILEALFHLEPMAKKDLAAKILKTAGNITTIINNLEKAELVVRVLSTKGKRLNAIHLTDKGRGLLEDTSEGQRPILLTAPIISWL